MSPALRCAGKNLRAVEVPVAVTLTSAPPGKESATCFPGIVLARHAIHFIRVGNTLMSWRLSSVRQLRCRCPRYRGIRPFRSVLARSRDEKTSQFWDSLWLRDVGAKPSEKQSDINALTDGIQAGNASARKAQASSSVLGTASPTYNHKGHGARITKWGYLIVDDQDLASLPRRTALIVSSMVKGLWPSDFYRLAATELPGESCKGGLVKAIVARDDQFNRVPSWLLFFESPYHAAAYQHRLRWYLHNTRSNLPVNFIQYIIGQNKPVVPPEGYQDPASGEDVWKCIYDFAIHTNTQGLNVTPVLSPLPEILNASFEAHEKWIRSDDGERCWPVRVWGVNVDQISVRRLMNISDWAEWPGGYVQFENMRTVRRTEYHGKEPSSWVANFKSENDALRFWKRWHRRELPAGIKGTGLIQVDPLW